MIFTSPRASPSGTFTLISVSVAPSFMVAATSPNNTSVTLSRAVPLMVTSDPIIPDPGENEDIDRGASKTNSASLVALPPGLTTTILPDTTLSVSFTLISVSVWESITKFTPPILTSVTLLKFVPVMVTSVPTVPLSGENDVIDGALCKTKSLSLVDLPPGPTTSILPEITLLLIVTLRDVSAQQSIGMATPPIRTSLAVPMFEPVIVTSVPTTPLVGENWLIIGAGTVGSTSSSEQLTINKTVANSVIARYFDTLKILFFVFIKFDFNIVLLFNN